MSFSFEEVIIMKKKGLDRDLIISFAALSLMAALGIIFFILFIFIISEFRYFMEVQEYGQ